jgi:acetyl-CoA synthetase
VVLPPTPETAAVFFGVWKLGAILLSISVLYGDDAIAHRLSDSEACLLVTDAANAMRFDRDAFVLDEQTLADAPTGGGYRASAGAVAARRRPVRVPAPSP